MRRLSESVALRVALAALAGLLIAEAVRSIFFPSAGAPPVVFAGFLTVVVAAIAARWASAPLERLVRRSAQDRRDAESDRRAAEADRDRLAALVDEIGEAVVIADETGHIERSNVAAESLFGADLVGRPIVEVVRDHEILDAIRNARADGDTVVHVERSDPARFQRAVTRRLGNRRVLLVVQDLTAMRRLETVRKDFVANVSHELRTPLASLKAMAEALESGGIADRGVALDFIRRMRGEIDGLTELVEDLLVLGRVESGRERFIIEPTRPVELMDRAADRIRPLAERAGVRLVVDAPADVPAVAADRDRVGQVFANLLHNATRHTPPGGEIRMTATPGDDVVRFSVRDTGDGIAAGDLDRIFERFYKGDKSRASGGTGLGLSIARHIVEAHGGSIEAASEGPGRGATFTFTLPILGR
jgi:two-component system, OmpR family, phosphate regulon sensor histidine kinase PhoR